jgi:hypothetical protein
VVDAVPSYNASFDPQRVIEAVNALVPLGKDRALAVIDEYLRVSSVFEDHGRDGVFLLNRVLFDVPSSGVMPDMNVGAGLVVSDPKLVPRFPLVIVDDIPLHIGGPYELGGLPQPPESDVAWFRKHGTLRKVAMVPPARPLEVVDAHVNGPLAKVVVVDDPMRGMLYGQALALVGTAYRPTADWSSSSPALATAWAKVRAEVATVAPTWNAVASHYTRADGTTVPPQVTAWQRVWWDFKMSPDHRARMTFERVSHTRVNVHLRAEPLDAGSVGSVVLGTTRVSDAAGNLIVELEVRAGSMESRTIELPLKASLRLTFQRLGKTSLGPVLVP